MEDAVCFLFFVLQTIRHLTAVFVATQSDIYSREVSFTVMKLCISIQHRIFSPTSCFCVMSTFTLMIGSLNITTTFVTCVCLIGSVIQVVLDHLSSLVLHFIAPELPSPLPPTRKPQPAVWSSPDGPVQHRALRERSGSAHTSQDVWYLPKLSSRLCFLLDLLTNTLLQVYPQTCGREAQKQHLSSGFILCSISAVGL